jgi:hypothetical protein
MSFVRARVCGIFWTFETSVAKNDERWFLKCAFDAVRKHAHDSLMFISDI